MGDQQLGIVDSTGGKEDQSVPTAVSGTINAHSVAAVGGAAYVPIPGSNAANPKASQVCGNVVGGTAAQMLAANQQGCIAVFTVIKRKDDKLRAR